MSNFELSEKFSSEPYRTHDRLSISEIFGAQKELAASLRDDYCSAIMEITEAVGIRSKLGQLTVPGSNLITVSQAKTEKVPGKIPFGETQHLTINSVNFSSAPFSRCLEVTVYNAQGIWESRIYVLQPDSDSRQHYALRCIHNDPRNMTEERIDLGSWNGRVLDARNFSVQKKVVGVGSSSAPVDPDDMTWHPMETIREVLLGLMKYELRPVSATV